MRHKREALAAKAELLMKLDEEIVEAVHYKKWGLLILNRVELDSALNAAADKLRLEAAYPDFHGGGITREPALPRSHLMKNCPT